MPLRPSLLLALLSLGFSCSMMACRQESPAVLDGQAILKGHDWWDNRDWAWYEEHIPFLETPDAELDATYYYRWEVLTKHLIYGSPETGYTFTEFIDRPFWSGTYGAISCPLGHQAYEIRWLKDRRIMEDFARYWFETPGAQPRSYSNWYGDAMWATYQVTADTAFLRTVYPHMQRQVAGWTEERWDPDHGMYRWVGAWDGMETNINSRLTDDEFGGGEGYRPTLNSYLYADMMAVSRTAALFGEGERADSFAARAAALKARVQEELWDPEREFFFHQFAFDEQGGIEAWSLTYQTGPHAGSPHGRELLGYVPWQFHLPDPGYEAAWRFLMDPDHFWAPFGPTGVEQGDPQFFVSPRCCVWSGNAWPYATSQTLTALANLLNDYDQAVVDGTDYWKLLQTYSLSHRRNGRPYIAEAADPFTGSWDGHNTFYHSEHYLHSGFIDQVVTGLVGLRPRADDTLRVNPLAPEAWDYFALEGVDYHGHDLTILWDRDGSRYGRGSGLVVFLDGREVARRPELGEIQVAIPPSAAPEAEPRLVNWAVNSDGGRYPAAAASSSHPVFPPFYAVDGNRWYHPSPPNRWVAAGWGGPWSGTGREGSGGQWESASPGYPQAPGSTPQGHPQEPVSPPQGYPQALDSLPRAYPGAQEEGATAPGSTPASTPGSKPGSTPPEGSEDEMGNAWFQVDFGVPRPLARIQVYFLDDVAGPPVEVVGEEENAGFPLEMAQEGLPVRAPVAFRLEAWNEGAWEEIPGQDRLPQAPEGRRANTIRFPAIRTAGIRVVMEPAAGATVGLTELEAWGPTQGSGPIGDSMSAFGPGQGTDGPFSGSQGLRNLALDRTDGEFPALSASFTSQGDALGQAVDGRISLTRYSRNRWTAFGSPNLSDWLAVDFGMAAEIQRVELFIYGDGRGVAAPEKYEVQVWNGAGWQTAGELGRVPEVPLAWAMNVVEVVPTVTERVRVLFRHALPEYSGISEIRVWGR